MLKIWTAAALVAATPPVALAQAATPVAEGTMLDVMVEGEASRVPDIAEIRTGVVTQGASAAAALTANAAQMRRVLAALTAAGVATRDVQTATVSLNPQYRYGDNQPPTITGYQATNSVLVRFRDIAQSGAILDALVKAGANQIDGPSLTIDALAAAQDEARRDAIVRARERAALYAGAIGMRVARIVEISESPGGGSPGPVLVARAQAKGATPIVPGEQRISVPVRVRFQLQ